jgi:hypothetical protein
MRQPHVDDFVRLTRDIPELALCRGEVGVVRSTWFAPATAYEVEFHPPGLQHERRALLLAEVLEVQEELGRGDDSYATRETRDAAHVHG